MSFFRRAGALIARFFTSAADPAAAAGELKLYSKDSGGVAQLFARASNGTVYQLTPLAAAIMSWGDDSIAAGADTRYLTPGDGATAITTSTTYDLPLPRAGTVRNLFVRHNAAVGNGNSVVYTVMKNGVATAVTVTLATGAVGQVSDLVNSVAFAQGDRITLQAVKAASIANGGIDVEASVEIT